MSGQGTPARPAAARRQVDGILLLDKPEGLSSNAALQRVRRAFNAAKAGHTGSLDPLASGLLPVCLGQATKASGLLLDADKTYDFTLALGERTATGDREGEIVERAAVPVLDPAGVRRIAAGFQGEQMQVPPMYSALKHEGERLYRLARKGVEVERAARRVVIHGLEFTGMVGAQLRFEVRCSKGTYVRTLAEDIARALGTVGHVVRLRRLALGPFVASGMHALAEVEEAAGNEQALDAMLLAPDAALVALPAVHLGAAEQSCVLQGQPVLVPGPGGSKVRIYGSDGRFLGVGQMTPEGRRLAPDRIMVDLAAATSATA